MESTLARLARLRRVLSATFGRPAKPWQTACGFAALRGAVAFGRALDAVFVTRLQRIAIDRPIVLFGNPRTGSTFLHRFLCRLDVGAGLPLYRMMLGSTVLQKALGPTVLRMEKRRQLGLYQDAIHRTGLPEIETDDAAALLAHLDGPLAYSLIFAHDEADPALELDERLKASAERDFAWIESLWRRNLAASGRDRVVAKFFSLGPRLPEFVACFPDARLIHIVRDPADSIASALSLAVSVQETALGFSTLSSESQARYIERIYRSLVFLLQSFNQIWTSQTWLHERVLVIRYDRMMSSFEEVMGEVLAFVGQSPSAVQRQTIRAEADKQRRYRSRHQYDLARFGLTKDDVRAACADYCRTFLPAATARQRAAASASGPAMGVIPAPAAASGSG